MQKYKKFKNNLLSYEKKNMSLGFFGAELKFELKRKLRKWLNLIWLRTKEIWSSRKILK